MKLRCDLRAVMTLAATAVLVGPAISACGSSSSSTSTSTGASAASTQSTSTGSQSSASTISPAVLTQMQQTIASYASEPTFKAPGPPINPKELAGKTIFTVPFATTIPFCSGLDSEMTQLASQFGVHTDIYPNQGQPSQWVAGLQTALNRQPNLVNVFCGVDPAQLKPQISALNNAHIPVVSGHNSDPSAAPIPGIAATAYANYHLAGQLEADWTIVQTQGKANVLVIKDVSDPSTPPLISGLQGEFNKCPACKVSYASVAVPNWGTQIGPVVASAINGNPNLNYIIPIYDGMVEAVIPPLVSTNVGNRVHVATFNATPSVVKLIQDHKFVTFDVGEDFNWVARAVLDQDFRVMLGKAPAKLSYAGMRIFDAQNAADAGNPPAYTNGYGTAASTGFATLWGQG